MCDPSGPPYFLDEGAQNDFKLYLLTFDDWQKLFRQSQSTKKTKQN